MAKVYKCPKCSKILQKKRIEYGLSSPEMQDDENIILGGCCITDESPKFAYQCFNCEKLFALDKGELIPFEEDEEIAEEDEIEKIDNDIETLEILDLLDDELF